MPSEDAIAGRALALARAAIDDLAEFIGDSTLDADAASTILAGPGQDRADDASERLETWERFAALNLVLGARCLRPDAP